MRFLRAGILLGVLAAMFGVLARPAPVAQSQTSVIAKVAAGWNLVAGPDGTVVPGALGPLYTFQADDPTYEVIPSHMPLHSGLGYWAYFQADTVFLVPPGVTLGGFIPLPPGQFVMIGNPSSIPMTVTGADVLYSYDPVNGYRPATTLAPGQGAWAMSVLGGAASERPTACSAASPSPSVTAPPASSNPLCQIAPPSPRP